VLPRVLGQEGGDGGHVGDQAKQTKTGKQDSFTPVFILLPNLTNRKSELMEMWKTVFQ
jgi:hypothetical protein